MKFDISEWRDMMADVVLVNSFTGRSVSGQPTYNMSTTLKYPCYIRMMNHKVLNKHGQEVVARGYAILGTTSQIGDNDLVTLPTDYVPRQPPLISVDIQPDEHGNHHVTLHF